MKYTELSCRDFTDILATKAPVPGGGGASALVGAIGTALCSMVGSLTVGKKKYAAVEEEMQELMKKTAELQRELLELAERDAEVFEPLSKAYSLPKATEEEQQKKAEIMEHCLKEACQVPLEIMGCCCRAIALLQDFAEKGSVMAVSDAGVAAACLRGALQGASLNVYINTGSMKDRAAAEAWNRECDAMLAEYAPKAEQVFTYVRGRLQK